MSFSLISSLFSRKIDIKNEISGTNTVSAVLNQAADGLVAGGKTDVIFLFFFFYIVIVIFIFWVFR